MTCKQLLDVAYSIVVPRNPILYAFPASADFCLQLSVSYKLE